MEAFTLTKICFLDANNSDSGLSFQRNPPAIAKFSGQDPKLKENGNW